MVEIHESVIQFVVTCVLLLMAGGDRSCAGAAVQLFSSLGARSRFNGINLQASYLFL